MSLHIKLSPEAQARLIKQQRQSTIMSIAISVLTCLLLGLLMTLFAIKIVRPEIPVIVTVNKSSAGEGTEEDVQPERIEPPTPPENISQILTSQSISDVAVPQIDALDFSDPVEDITFDVEDFGEVAAAEDVAAATIDVIKLPPTLQKRCSLEDRLERLRTNGAGKRAEEAEAAVVKTLDWLRDTQASDGSWSGSRFPAAMTGLSLLTFLGHCDTPKSREYGEAVNNAIAYLVNVGMKNDGLLVSDKDDKQFPYEHGIATYALGEAYTFCKIIDIEIPNLKEVLTKAGQAIVDSQTEQGSWFYSFQTGNANDNSIGGWQLQALKACKHSGIEPKGINRAISQALEFLETSQGEDGSIGYRGKPNPKNPIQNQNMAAVGALSFQIWNKTNNKVPRNAIKFLDKTLVHDYNHPSYDLYGHYYASQAMINAGGDFWRKYNQGFLSSLLKAQNPDGTFKKLSGTFYSQVLFNNDRYGVHYRTCLATLMLESYYRFLPATGKKSR